MARRLCGFTTIELMIVIALIAIILAFVLPSFVGNRKSANEAAAIASLRSIAIAQEQYRIRFSVYADPLSLLVDNGYIAINEMEGGDKTSGYTVAMLTEGFDDDGYRTDFGTYTEQLDGLSFIAFTVDSNDLTSRGYKFVLSYAGSHTWGAEANPMDPGTTGNRYFWVDESGVMRGENGPASATDSPLGAGDSGDSGEGDSVEIAPEKKDSGKRPPK